MTLLFTCSITVDGYAAICFSTQVLVELDRTNVDFLWTVVDQFEELVLLWLGSEGRGGKGVVVRVIGVIGM